MSAILNVEIRELHRRDARPAARRARARPQERARGRARRPRPARRAAAPGDRDRARDGLLADDRRPRAPVGRRRARPQPLARAQQAPRARRSPGARRSPASAAPRALERRRAEPDSARGRAGARAARYEPDRARPDPASQSLRLSAARAARPAADPAAARRSRARAHRELPARRSTPEHRLHWQRDPHGNHVARVTFKAGQRVDGARHRSSSSRVDIRPVNPFDFFVDDRAKHAAVRLPRRARRRARAVPRHRRSGVSPRAARATELLAGAAGERRHDRRARRAQPRACASASRT